MTKLRLKKQEKAKKPTNCFSRVFQLQNPEIEKSIRLLFLMMHIVIVFLLASKSTKEFAFRIVDESRAAIIMLFVAKRNNFVTVMSLPLSLIYCEFIQPTSSVLSDRHYGILNMKLFSGSTKGI